MLCKLGLEELLHFGGMKHTKAKKLSGLLLMISLLVLIYISISQLIRIRNMLPNGDFFQYLKLNLYLNRFKINKSMISRARVLSYSLFGNNWEMYKKAVESVAKEAAEDSLYHNWTVRIYHDNYITKAVELVNLTKLYQNLEFINVSNFAYMTNINGMVWRFLTLSDTSVDVTCVRDLDSKLLKRDSDAVKVWLESGKLVHIMRDHPRHSVPILGGMWCYRNELNRELGFKIAKLCAENSMLRDPVKQIEATKGNDQSVLRSYAWPLVRENALIHDSYLCKTGLKGEPFPTKRSQSGEFVGQARGGLVRAAVCPKECRPNDHQDWEFC